VDTTEWEFLKYKPYKVFSTVHARLPVHIIKHLFVEADPPKRYTIRQSLGGFIGIASTESRTNITIPGLNHPLNGLMQIKIEMYNEACKRDLKNIIITLK